MPLIKRISIAAFIAYACSTNFVRANDNYMLFDFDPDGSNSGRTVANFLLLPAGAQQLGLGTVASMIAWDATDIAMATSNTAFFGQYQFAVTHLEWLMGLRKEYAAGCIPVLDVGTIGLYSQIFTFGRLENARDIDEVAVSNPQSVEVNVGASYARELIPQKLGIGATASYIESRLAGDDGRAFNAGIDGTFKPMKKLVSRAYIRNLGTPIRYNDTWEPLPLQMGAAAEYIPKVADDTLLRKSLSVSVGLGVQKTADLPVQIGLGVDFSPWKPVSIRAGYEYSYGHDIGLAGLSFGGGLMIKGYGADVAFKNQSPEFGWVWCATVKYATEDIKQKSAMDYYKIAEKHYKKERYRMCIEFATRALKLNPDMWQAHELITLSIAKMRRNEGTEIALIYTGNVQGQFAPLDMGQATMGGLARQATAIKALRAQFPISITVDAGNFVKHNTHLLKAQFAHAFYQKLKYDAAAIGPREIEWGLERYIDENRKARSLFIASNITATAAGAIDEVRVIKAGKYSFALFSVVGPALVRNAKERTSVTSPFKFINKQLQSERIKRCNLRILILHTPWEIAKTYVSRLKGIDIVIMGSLSQKFDVPMKVGSTIFLSAGERGKYTGALTLRFDRKGNLLSYNNRLVPLIDEVAADAEIDLATRNIIAKIDLESQDLADRDLAEVTPDGVFAFLSSRHNSADIYLKVPLKQSEFPLTNTPQRSFRPRISYATDKVVYIEDNDSTQHAELKIMDIAGTNKQTFSMPGSVREAEFTPDGVWVLTAVQSESGIDIFRVKSGGSDALPVVTWPDADESQIAVSPNGTQVAFAGDRDGKWQIFLTDTGGMKPVRITDPNAHHNSPEFSPDGNYLAYLSDRHSFGGKKDLWVHTMSTGADTRITNGIAVNEFCWLDDNQTVIFAGGLDSLRLYHCDIFTQERRIFIKSDSTKTYNETSPGFTRLKGKIKVLYVREYETGEKQIFWTDADGSNDKQVVNSKKEDWLE